MARGTKPKIQDPDKVDTVLATARIPVALYNDIVKQIEQNNQTLHGPLTVSEFLCSAAKFYLEEDLFSKTQEVEFKLHGE